MDIHDIRFYNIIARVSRPPLNLFSLTELQPAILALPLKAVTFIAVIIFFFAMGKLALMNYNSFTYSTGCKPIQSSFKSGSTLFTKKIEVYYIYLESQIYS